MWEGGWYFNEVASRAVRSGVGDDGSQGGGMEWSGVESGVESGERG